MIANARHIIRDSYVLNDTDRTVLMYRVMLFSHLLRDRLRQQSHIVCSLSSQSSTDSRAVAGIGYAY